MKRYLLLFTLIMLAGCTWGDAPTADPSADGVEVVASGLSVPWDVAFLNETHLLVTERTGDLLLIDDRGGKEVIASFDASASGEAGLLGLELHPEFSQNRQLYLYLTTPEQENQILRYEFRNGELTDETIIFDGIPGARYHDGGRMRFGPDGKLYVAVGDATEPELAQDTQTLHGSILRLEEDGSVPDDSPFGNAVYSYGHRNPQGIAWIDGQLYSTEHGRSGVQTGMDELNRIEAGANYGWPDIEGDEQQEGMREPLAHSGPDVTWAPASLATHEGTLYFGGLRGQALYAATQEEGTWTVKEALTGYGRIRTVLVGPEGMLYVTTSNTDGRGVPAPDDDKLLRINPGTLR